MPPEFENYFCYAAMWAFGGTLVEEHRPYFSQWWKEQWNDYVMLPRDDEVGNQLNKTALLKCQCFKRRALIWGTFQIELEFRSVGF